MRTSLSPLDSGTLHHFVKVTTSFSRGRCSLTSAHVGSHDTITSTTWLHAEMMSSYSMVFRCACPRLHFFMYHLVALLYPKRSNQSMKPTAPPRNAFSVFATAPCRGLPQLLLQNSWV